MDSFVRQKVDILQHKIKTTLTQAGIEADTVPGLQQQFDDFELPFDGLQTKYARQKYIKQNYFYVVSFPIIIRAYFFYVHTYIFKKRAKCIKGRFKLLIIRS